MNALFKITIVTLNLLIYFSLSAAYLTYVPVTVNQPDGAQLSLFASGDEFYNWLHDENGFTVVQDKTTGFYCYANLINYQLLPTNILPGIDDPQANGLEPNINLPPEIIEQNIIYFNETAPASLGREDFLNATGKVTLNNIVVYVRFADQDEFPEEQENYTDLFNKTGENVNSTVNYFEEASYGKLNVSSSFYPVNNSTVILSYQDSHDRNYYIPKSIDNPSGYDGTNVEDRRKREHALVSNAINFVRSEIPPSLNLDFNNDGNIDNITFIVRGNVNVVRNETNILWPHKWTLYRSFEYVNTKRIYDFVFLFEEYNDNGIVCHEITHTFGAPDLYHNIGAFGEWSQPVHRWDLMALNTDPPQHMSTYIKYRYCGWIDDVPEIKSSGTYTVNPITKADNNCYKIPIKNSDEYLFIEYRVNTGFFESKLPNSGLIVYRINDQFWGRYDRSTLTRPPQLAGGINDEVYAYRLNGKRYRKGYPEKANFSANHGRREFNNITDPFCFTSDGSNCGVTLKNIGSSTSPTMLFTVDFCNIEDIVYDEISQIPPNSTIYQRTKHNHKWRGYS